MNRVMPAAPGLKIRARKKGPPALYWVARSDIVASGFRPSTVRLIYDPADPHFVQNVVARCEYLQQEMLTFAGEQKIHPVYDGTIRSAIRIYLTDPDSPFHMLKPGTQKPYDFYAGKIMKEIGARKIRQCDGRDARRWFKGWSADGKIAKANTCMAILRSALAYGVMCRRQGCKDLHDILSVMQFEKPRARAIAPTTEQVVAIREAAHRLGRPSIALATAIQFEGMLRLWDVAGQWMPIDASEASAVLGPKGKWIGPQWSDIDADLVLKWRPTKTERTSSVVVEADLSLCDMVVEEIAKVAEDRRTGPLIVNEVTGLPYTPPQYQKAFRAIATAAGVPKDVWARDMRAGGITDARKRGARLDDTSKAAGHSDMRTTARIYDRGTLEAHRRVANARRGNGSGTP